MTGEFEQNSNDQPRQPGRPRDPGTDRVILETALKQLVDRGYAGLSIERVASEAGIGKTTIYRRYSTKQELAVAAVGALKDSMGTPPDTGNARVDVIEMIVQNQDALQRGPGISMIGALLVEERRNPELLALFRDRIIRPRRDDVITVLKRGVDRGEIRADANLEVTVEALIGSILARHLLGSPASRQQIEQTVDTIWTGLANHLSKTIHAGKAQ